MAQVETFEVRKKTFLPLPIVAPDFSYTMDLMIMSSVYQNIVRPGDITKFEWRRTELNNRTYNNNYQYILIFIETTSRKVWVFPQKTKTARETYKNFILFRTKVNNRISRLLSDSDTAFALIKQNCSYFNYCQVVAGDGNHTALSRVDRFVSTFRRMIFTCIDKVLEAAEEKGARRVIPRIRSQWVNHMWCCLRVYNHETKHDALWLYDTSTHLDGYDDWVNKIVRYTPDEVWKSPQLRYRIRLRNYLNMAKNYKNKKGVFARLLKANYVYKRVDVQHYAKGAQLKFAKVPFLKGPRFGNSFMVDGQLVSYRNLYPAPDPAPPRRARVAEPSRPRGSKYNLDKYVDQMVNAYMRLEEQMNARRSNGVPQRAPPYDDDDDDDDYDSEEEEEEEENVLQRAAPAPPPTLPLSSDDEEEEEEENNNDVVIPPPPRRNYSKQIQKLLEEAHHYTEHYNRVMARKRQQQRAQQRQQQSGSSNSRSSRRRR